LKQEKVTDVLVNTFVGLFCSDMGTELKSSTTNPNQEWKEYLERERQLFNKFFWMCCESKVHSKESFCQDSTMLGEGRGVQG
jgi:hypothetical protein